MIYIDGDLPTEKGDCEFHCSPTCHPAQIGPDWKFGCTHNAWPSNRYGDFVPIVECDGLKSKCEMKGKKFLSNYLRGRTNSLNHSKRKTEKIEKQISFINEIKSS